jgi:hypothetical protein
MTGPCAALLVPRPHPQVVRLEGIYLQALPIEAAWDKAAELVMAKYEQLLEQAGISDDEVTPADVSKVTVVLDLPCPFLALRTLSCMDTTHAVAASLAFNHSLVAMADAVVAGMVAAGASEFNGAHLRWVGTRLRPDWARRSDAGWPRHNAPPRTSMAPWALRSWGSAAGPALGLSP